MNEENINVERSVEEKAHRKAVDLAKKGSQQVKLCPFSAQEAPAHFIAW